MPIVTNFQTIMDLLNNAKSRRSENSTSDSKLTYRSSYPTHNYPSYPYIYHTIKKNILPTSALEMVNQNQSDLNNKYFAYPESFSAPVYTDAGHRQTIPEIGTEFYHGAPISGSSYTPIAQHSAPVPVTSFLGQQSYPSIYKPYTLYGYGGGGDFGYIHGLGTGHDSGHSSGHHHQYHPPPPPPSPPVHHGSSHHSVQYIPIPIPVNNEKSGNHHHKHDLTTLLAAIALAAGLPLLLGALLLPLGVLFLLNLATLIAVLATGLGGAGNGTRTDSSLLNRGRRSIIDHAVFGFEDYEFLEVVQNIIYDFILEAIQQIF